MRYHQKKGPVNFSYQTGRPGQARQGLSSFFFIRQKDESCPTGQRVFFGLLGGVRK